MLSRKNTLQEVIGKTIQAIVFRSGRDVNPESQLFLVFEDDTYLEFYGQEIGFVRSLSEGDTAKAIDYARKFSTEVLVVNRYVTELQE
jgi:hypothetical protein